MEPRMRGFERHENSLSGTFAINERLVPVHVELDGDPEDRVLAFVELVASDLEAHIERAKDVATSELIETYNSGWNEYELVQDDGTTTAVCNPKLTPAEFKKQLVLTSLGFSGSDCVEFWFGDTELFWGHSVIVTVFDNLNWQGAGAQLFG
jgi:hypothetical protein